MMTAVPTGLPIECLYFCITSNLEMKESIDHMYVVCCSGYEAVGKNYRKQVE